MPKQSSERQSSHRLPPISLPAGPEDQDSLDLLRVGGLQIPLRRLEGYQSSRKKEGLSGRENSNQSLGIQLQSAIQKAVEINKQRRKGALTQAVKKTEEEELPKSQFLVNSSIQRGREIGRQEVQPKEEQEQEQSKFHFIEKKMRIGQKSKAALMKQFILETLMKGKAEGNCLTITKGTAHCNYSPPREKPKEKTSKQRRPLILPSQQSSAALPPRPRQRPLPLKPMKRRPQIGGESGQRIFVRGPSLIQNSKWVAIAKKWEKGGREEEVGREDIVESIVEQQQQRDNC